MHAGLTGLAGEHVGHPGLPETSGSEDRDEAPGTDQGPETDQVLGASQQVVGVELHSAAHRRVGGEERSLHALQGRVGIDPHPVGQVPSVGLVARQRGRVSGGRGLGGEQRFEHLDVVGVRLVHLHQPTDGLRVTSAARQRQRVRADQAGLHRAHVPAYLREGPLTRDIRDPAHELGRRGRARDGAGRVVVHQRLAGSVHQGLRHPRVDGVIGEREPVAAVVPLDRALTALRTHA